MKKIKLFRFLIIILGLFFAQSQELLGAFSFQTVCQPPLTSFSSGGSTFDVSFPPGGGTTCETISDCPAIKVPDGATIYSIKMDMELTDPASEVGTPYIWIPASIQNKLIQLKTSDGSLVHVFSNSNDGCDPSAFSNPSRITVTPGGDVWVGNRNAASVTRLGIKDGCAEDGNSDCYECKDTYSTCGSDVRGVTFDSEGNIWAGGDGSNCLVRLCGHDNCKDVNGAIGYSIGDKMKINLSGGTIISTRVYGLIADIYGYVWTSGGNTGDVVGHVDITDNLGAISTLSTGNVYGIGIDNEGDIWTGMHANTGIWEIDGADSDGTDPTIADSKGSGIGVEENVCATTSTNTGLAVDRTNNVWSTGYDQNRVYVIKDGNCADLFTKTKRPKLIAVTAGDNLCADSLTSPTCVWTSANVGGDATRCTSDDTLGAIVIGAVGASQCAPADHVQVDYRWAYYEDVTENSIYNIGEDLYRENIAVDCDGADGNNPRTAGTCSSITYASGVCKWAQPHGMAVDFDNHAWLVCDTGEAVKYAFHDDGDAIVEDDGEDDIEELQRINLCTIPGVGCSNVSGATYNYSDMTGLRTSPKTLTIGLNNKVIPISATGTFNICSDPAAPPICSNSSDCDSLFLPTNCGSPSGECEIPLKIFSVNAGDYTLKNLEVVYGKQVPVTTGGLVPCGREWNDLSTPWNETQDCNMCHLVILVYSIINFLMKLVVLISILALVVAGLIYVKTGGDSSLITAAKQNVNKILYGFVIVFVAWAIINLVMILLGFNDPLKDGSWKKFSCEVDLSYCGDGIVQSGEDCDGANLNGQSCASLGLGGGVLSCNAGCSFDTSLCGSLYKITGNVKDAMTLLPISVALMELLDGAGNVIATVNTDASGNYEFLNLTGGNTYTVTVTKTGYASGNSGAFVLSADTVKDFALGGSGAGVARIVLSWGATPADLDSHLIFGATEIWYWNKGPDNGSQLDVDTQGGFGPETITINALVAGDTYTYYVQDFSDCLNNAGDWGTTAGAKVEVYNSGGVKIKEYNSPGAGCRWYPFTIDGNTGTITDL